MNKAEDIVKIEFVKNVNIKNTFNNYVFPLQNIIKIDYRSGKSRTIDLICNRDITSVENLEVIYNSSSKEKVLFEEEEI